MKVRIKPEFCESKNEPRIIYKVIEDNGDRCLIEPVKSEMAIKPTEMVEKYMVEVIE